jgi:ankyrin repeat protein
MMRKIILPILLCCFTLGSINATTKKALKAEKTILTKNYYDVSPFCKLIKMGNYEAVKALIEAGENVNKKSFGLTPLMFAARYNKAKIVQLLIANGAKLSTKSDKGKITALEMAKRSKAHDAFNIIKKSL